MNIDSEDKHLRPSIRRKCCDVCGSDLRSIGGLDVCMNENCDGTGQSRKE